MKKHAGIVALTAFVASSLFAAEWTNLDEDHYVSGRKCSSGYLQGKVVLAYRDKALAPRMEEIWTSFKSKPFVLVGSLAEGSKEWTHPVYRDVAVQDNPCEEPIFVIDSLGKRRYRGADERKATEIVVTLLTDMEAPKTEAQWRQFLDYEFENLPGHAYARFEVFKKKFPKSAKDYARQFAELSKIPRIKDLATLVKFAKAAKDHKAINPKKARLVKSRLAGRIDSALEKYASLKESENPLVVREAKNALADLKWAKAAL